MTRSLRLVVQLGLICVACSIPAGVVKGPAPTNCVSVSPSANDYWCQTNCATGRCPKQICQCNAADGASSALVADATVGTAEAAEAAASEAAEAKDASKSKHSEEKGMAKHTSTQHSATWLAKHPPAKKMKAKPASQPSAVADDVRGSSTAGDVVIIGGDGEEAPGVTGPHDGAPPPDRVEPESCVAISPGATDNWCVDTCGSGPCPEDFCKCSRLITTPP
jgi:hypothetical protein